MTADNFPLEVPESFKKTHRVIDEIFRPKKAKSKYDPVVVYCYYSIEKWESRQEAIDFYLEGMLSCDGCEAERYMHVWAGLQHTRRAYVTDGDY